LKKEGFTLTYWDGTLLASELSIGERSSATAAAATISKTSHFIFCKNKGLATRAGKLTTLDVTV
jgi:hypothetical protein